MRFRLARSLHSDGPTTIDNSSRRRRGHKLELHLTRRVCIRDMKCRGGRVLILSVSFFALFVLSTILHAPKATDTTSLQHVQLASARETFGVVRHCSGVSYLNITSLAYSNSEQYATRHGYEHFEANATTMPSLAFFTPKSWLKVGFMWQVLTNRGDVQWLLWLDCDALIKKLDESIQDLLSSLGVADDHDIVVAQDIAPSPFNLGVMFIRNTPWTRDVLGRLMVLAENEDIRKHPWWEQHALHHLFSQNYRGVQTKLLVVQKRARINAFASLGEEDQDTFIWHRVNCHDQPICDRSYMEKFCGIHPRSHYCL